MNQAKKDQKEALHATVNTQVAKVQYALNKKMTELNEAICGTGTSFKGLILFDQACLELTRLPFFIHDSLTFSNVEISREDKSVEMYGKKSK